MNALTVIEIFYSICFVIMTFACAFAGITGYTYNRVTGDKIISLILGTIFSYAFAHLAVTTIGRLLA